MHKTYLYRGKLQIFKWARKKHIWLTHLVIVYVKDICKDLLDIKKKQMSWAYEYDIAYSYRKSAMNECTYDFYELQ